MKRTLFFITLLFAVLLCRTPTAEALIYGATNYRINKQNILAGTYQNDPIWQFIYEVETSMDGGGGVASWVFTPGTEPSTASEGEVYYDSAGNNLKLYTGAAWVDIDLSGASSLATAYTAGSKILAPTLEVEIEVADSSNNPALRLDFDDATSNAQDVFVIDNAGDDADAVSIQINGTAGDDIRGSGDVWSIGQDGAAILVAIDVVGNITLENDEVIKNDNNGEIELGDGTEDTAFAWGTNELQLSSDTGVVTVNWGDLDAFTGLNTVAFDGAVANTITQTGTGAADDLTISQATSGQDASLILQSSGTGTDALSLISSVADIKANSADNIDIDAADNITVDTADGSYTLTIAGATNGDYAMTAADTMSMIAVDTITIQNTEATKDITVNSVLGSIYIEAEEDAANAILITADGGTSSTLRLHNDTGTGATSIDLLSDVGGITATASAGAIVLTGTGASAGDVTISAGDIMTLTSVDTKIFDGAAAETWIIEGTADGFEATVVFTDPTADVTWTFPAAATDTFAVMASTLATNAPEIANSVTGGTNQLIFEGTADAFETILSATDATADATLSLPDDSGQLAYLADGGKTTKDATNAAIPLTDAIVEGTSGAASAWSLADGKPGQILTVVIVTDGGEATITPDTTFTGWATVVLTDDIDSVTFLFADTTSGWIILGTASDGTNIVAVTQ